MKVVQINATCGVGSTGKICVAVSELLSARGIENYILFSEDESDYPLGIKYESFWYKKFQALLARILGNNGLNCYFSTKQLIKELERINPDIVHLHNIHSHDVNMEKLLRYLAQKKVKVFWTFHDCWAFTGYCYYYLMADCDKWKCECNECPQKKAFSWFVDRSTYLFKKKAEVLKNLNLEVITPSEWMAGEVKKSFLKDFPIHVINNGIDLDTFNSYGELIDREEFGIGNQKIVLAVVNGYDLRKGIDIINKLPDMLPSDYVVVIVGLNSAKNIHKDIITIGRTKSKAELAKYYRSVEVFINPTREDTFPTTNIEAIACGTPVVTFDVGGSAEMLDDEIGIVVEHDNIEEFVAGICSVNKTKYVSCRCRKRAENAYDERKSFSKYLDLYLSNGFLQNGV